MGSLNRSSLYYGTQINTETMAAITSGKLKWGDRGHPARIIDTSDPGFLGVILQQTGPLASNKPRLGNISTLQRIWLFSRDDDQDKQTGTYLAEIQMRIDIQDIVQLTPALQL